MARWRSECIPRGHLPAVLNGRGTRVAISQRKELRFVEVWRSSSRFWRDCGRFALIFRCKTQPESGVGLLDGGHRAFGVFLVFHAKRVLFVLPTAVAKDTEGAADGRKSQTHYRAHDGSERSDHFAEAFHHPDATKLIASRHHTLTSIAWVSSHT